MPGSDVFNVGIPSIFFSMNRLDDIYKFTLKLLQVFHLINKHPAEI